MEQIYSKRQAARDIFRLAWPTVMEQILTTAVSYVDTAMVGHIGPDASAAVGVTMTVNWLINGTVSALGIGFLAYIARAVGARQHELARRASAQAVLAVLLSGVLFTLLPLLLAAKIPEWMNADPHLRSEAAEYFFILYIPMLFRSATIIFGTVLRASGDTRTPMVVNGAMNAVNVVLNFFFIYETRAVTALGRAITMPGLGLGVSGAAIASAISFVVGGVWMTAALLRNPLVSPRGSTLRPDSAILKPCLRVAIPAALQRFATSFGYVAFSSMINTLGATSTAAHTIANTAESAFYIPGYGMQAEFIVMTLSGAALFFGAEAVMSLFTQDEIVIRTGARVLRMVALTEPIYGVAVILEGIFNGVGDTMHTFVFNVVGMWGVRILGTYIFVIRLGQDLTSAWACMIAHNIALGAMLTARYLRGRWNPLAENKN
ncbi:MAG: MATE family efflux transporter [Clostridia bacterium]|nr:MATE family efflux transporter [Clostridia bacterium]